MGSMTDTWVRLQSFEKKSYQACFAATGSYLGHFSVPAFKATAIIRDILAVYHLCLDVGCGILPKPNYMNDTSVYYGIDPFFGEYKRAFPFTQAIGEYLPFPSNTFDAVLFMSSIDHAIEPIQALREARRVGRTLVVWTGLRTDAEIARWKQSGKNYDIFHQRGFSEKLLIELIREVGITTLSKTFLKGNPGKYPDTYLFIG